MLTKRSVTGHIATAMAAGALFAGALAVTSVVNDAAKVPAATHSVAAVGTSGPSQTSNPPTDVCHDM
jgi:hypothetical protein